MPSDRSLSSPEFKTLQVDLSTVDLDSYAPLLTSLAHDGITFTTLSDAQEQEPDWLALFCDLDNDVRSHDPKTPRTVAQMAERLVFMEIVPTACFLARRDRQYIGSTYLFPSKDDPGCLKQGYTGIRPEYRRQGIATALKVYTVEYAKQQGFERLVTTVGSGNLPSLRLNEKFGFRYVAESATEMNLQTSLGSIILETARPEELPIVMGILDECAAWLHSNGIAQWASPQPPHEWEKMKRQIEMGNVFLARLETDRRVVGTLRIEWQDSLWPNDAQAGYVHSLAIRNDFRGHRIGENLLDWAQGQIAAQGRSYIRLDCWDKNSTLCRYYEGIGFRRCGDFEVRGWTGALYEKKAVPRAIKT